MAINLTERAALEIKHVMTEQKFNEGEYNVRISVVGGGCSGIGYGLAFQKKEESDGLNDLLYSQHGVPLVLDRRSDTLLDGATVDFYEGLDRRGFVFENPNVVGGSCGGGGCGSCGV